MRRLLLAAGLLLAAFAPGLARADSYCFAANLEILGEPYLAHMTCVSCPITDCPAPPASDKTFSDPSGSTSVFVHAY